MSAQSASQQTGWVAFYILDRYVSVPCRIVKSFRSEIEISGHKIGQDFLVVESIPYAIPGSTKEYTYWIGEYTIEKERVAFDEPKPNDYRRQP